MVVSLKEVVVEIQLDVRGNRGRLLYRWFKALKQDWRVDMLISVYCQRTMTD